MNHVSSRKRFLAKLIGLVGLGGLMPSLLAGATSSTPSAQERPKVLIRPDNRAVARRDDLV